MVRLACTSISHLSPKWNWKRRLGMLWRQGAQNTGLSIRKVKLALKFTVWSQCTAVSDRLTDRGTNINIMAIARRFVVLTHRTPKMTQRIYFSQRQCIGDLSEYFRIALCHVISLCLLIICNMKIIHMSYGSGLVNVCDKTHVLKLVVVNSWWGSWKLWVRQASPCSQWASATESMRLTFVASRAIHSWSTSTTSSVRPFQTSTALVPR